MEPQNDDVSSSTNWSVAVGSLADRVTFESSLSPPIDADADAALNTASGASSLILRRPSPDSEPCEITINFTQKHEVQQIYVCSTARVFEIYYAPDSQSDNEYLCTVRCGIAARDGDVLHTADNEEVCSAISNGSLKEVSAENLRNGNNLSPSEDDWVEVKVPDSQVLDKKSSSFFKQDFHEATAQMSDVTPCISLTVRLLSLEKKDRVHIDEIYVFADLADSANLVNETSTAENSTGSSLMAMLMPTLLQLSKTRSVNQTQDSQMIGSRSFDSTSAATKIQTNIKSSVTDHQEVMFQDACRDTFDIAPLQVSPVVPVTETKSDTAYDHVERSMDHLISRMGRIEDLLLRFEDKLVQPISRIEARLERVEQQLAVLSKQSHNSSVATCSRFCTPSVSCMESDSKSYDNGGNDYPSCDVVISGNKDAQSEAVPTTLYYVSDSVNPPKLVSGPVVDMAKVSSDDENDEDQLPGLVKDTPRPALTIDNALASALAGFLSLTSNCPRQPFSIKAPDFLDEDDDSPNTKASVGDEIGTWPSLCFDESDGIHNVKDSVELGSSSYNEDNDGAYDKQSFTPEGVHLWQEHHEITGEDKRQGTCSENVVGLGMAQTNFCETTEEIDNGVVITEVSNIANSGKTEIPNGLPENGIVDEFNNTQDDGPTKEITEENPETPAKEEKGENSEDVLKNIFEFSRASSVMDFETSVLDVKFTSFRSGNETSYLAALLSQSPESMTEASSIKESADAAPVNEESSLILVEDGEQVDPVPEGSISVDTDFFSVPGPLGTWGANMQCETSNSHETSAASLI